MPLNQLKRTNKIPVFNYLENAGDLQINDNGSVTPIDFKWQPSSGVWLMTELRVVLADGATPGMTEFGDLGSALTNGLQLIIKCNGVETVLATIKNNNQMALIFSDRQNSFGGTGFLDTADCFVGVCSFSQEQQDGVILDSSLNDFVSMRVRDNLTNIDNFFLAAKAYQL